MNITDLKFDQNGLIPAVVQNYKTGKVLMLGYMNQESFKKTMESGTVWFFSRSRNQLWNKGETSGNFLDVIEIASDCDDDAVLIKVEPQGPTCHTGEESCFHHSFDAAKNEKAFDQTVLFDLFDVIESRKTNPIEGSYTNYLFEKGIDKILKKVGEETANFLAEAMPRYAVICCDEDGPNAKVASRLTAIGAQTYRTGVCGTVILTVDSDGISVKTQYE